MENGINGLLTILQLRGVEQFKTERGRQLFRLVQLHLVSLFRSAAPPTGVVRELKISKQTRPLMQKCQDSVSTIENDINGDTRECSSNSTNSAHLSHQSIVC